MDPAFELDTNKHPYETTFVHYEVLTRKIGTYKAGFNPVSKIFIENEYPWQSLSKAEFFATTLEEANRICDWHNDNHRENKVFKITRTVEDVK
jgi:hypothetical protein